MKKTLAFITGMLLLSAASNAMAWKHFENAKVYGVTAWQDNGVMLFEFSPTEWCYVPAAEKNTIALLLTLYNNGKRASVHCHDTVELHNGQPARRLHRIISLPN